MEAADRCAGPPSEEEDRNSNSPYSPPRPRSASLCFDPAAVNSRGSSEFQRSASLPAALLAAGRTPFSQAAQSKSNPSDPPAAPASSQTTAELESSSACILEILRLLESDMPRGTSLLCSIPANLPRARGGARALRRVIIGCAEHAIALCPPGARNILTPSQRCSLP